MVFFEDRDVLSCVSCVFQAEYVQIMFCVISNPQNSLQWVLNLLSQVDSRF